MFKRRPTISLVNLLYFLAVVGFFFTDRITMMHMWCSFSHGAKIWRTIVLSFCFSRKRVSSSMSARIISGDGRESLGIPAVGDGGAVERD